MGFASKLSMNFLPKDKGDGGTVLPSPLSLGRKFIESFDANPIPAPVQNLSC